MGTNSQIEWTDATWNPLAGCSYVSPGCKNCYAASMAKRLMAMGQDKYVGVVNEQGKWTGIINYASEDVINQPLRWTKPRMIFVNSMSDLFHEAVPFAFIEQVFEVMMRADWHTFQVLTKRPKRMVDFQQWIFDNHLRLSQVWPLPNVWMGTSIEDQKRAHERIPHLLDVQATVRFLSAEPLLGKVNLGFWGQDMETGEYSATHPGIHWVIVGGESGPNARPMHPDWVRDILEQCHEAGIPFFFKQWGEWAPDCLCQTAHPHQTIKRPDPGYIGVMFRCGKKRSGRILDGRTWNETPIRR